jgi:hypothetical protein
LKRISQMPRGLLKTIKSVFILAQFFVTTPTLAKEITVFDIRRAVSLENNQEMPKDFYINAGLETGLKPGMVITVNRRQTLYDPFQSKSPGDLVVPVGKLRVIHAQENIAVARMVEILGRENLPGLEFDAIMVGDRLDMSTAKMSKGSDKAMNDQGSGAVVTVEVQELQVQEVPVAVQVAPAAAAPTVTAAVTSPVVTAQAPVKTDLATSNPLPRESSSQLPNTSLPSEGPTL